MAKKARKKSKKASKAKTVKRGKPKRLKPPRSKKFAKKHVKKAARAKRQPAKVASAFQVMIDTINETERLRAKNERGDVTDETG
jgi:hypothetical protein